MRTQAGFSVFPILPPLLKVKAKIGAPPTGLSSSLDALLYWAEQMGPSLQSSYQTLLLYLCMPQWAEIWGYVSRKLLIISRTLLHQKCEFLWKFGLNWSESRWQRLTKSKVECTISSIEIVKDIGKLNQFTVQIFARQEVVIEWNEKSLCIQFWLPT